MTSLITDQIYLKQAEIGGQAQPLQHRFNGRFCKLQILTIINVPYLLYTY